MVVVVVVVVVAVAVVVASAIVEVGFLVVLRAFPGIIHRRFCAGAPMRCRWRLGDPSCRMSSHDHDSTRSYRTQSYAETKIDAWLILLPSL